jgi:hypothetical protein
MPLDVSCGNASGPQLCLCVHDEHNQDSTPGSWGEAGPDQTATQGTLPIRPSR